MRELLIVGAGIAGMNAAAAARRGSNHVTLIDEHNYQTLAPALARGAAGLAPFAQMTLMLPAGDAQLTRVRGTATRIDPVRRAVVVDGREYVGDRLIIAVGRGPARSPEASLGPVHRPYVAEAAAKLRLAWHGALAAAANRRPLPGEPVRLAIVGGGQFGCELALTFATMRPLACQRYGLPESAVEIALYEEAARVLPDWPPRAAAIMSHEMYLSEVDVQLQSRVVARSEQGVRLASGAERPADIVVWACGRQSHPLLAGPAMPRTAAGLSVDDYLRVTGYTDVYAIGDAAGGVGGWDWALASAHTAVVNATSRLTRRHVKAPPGRRFVALPAGRVMSVTGERLSAYSWHLPYAWRLLAERRLIGGWPLVMQAWPSPAPDHSLAAWRDATERRRGRHAERRI